MMLTDFDGEHCITTEADLLQRLRTVRGGIYGAFYRNMTPTGRRFGCSSTETLPAYIFPENEFAGVLTSTGKTLQALAGAFHFLQVTNSEADSCEMDSFAVMIADDAYAALMEFFRIAKVPSSIDWIAL